MSSTPNPNVNALKKFFEQQSQAKKTDSNQSAALTTDHNQKLISKKLSLEQIQKTGPINLIKVKSYQYTKKEPIHDPKLKNDFFENMHIVSLRDFKLLFENLKTDAERLVVKDDYTDRNALIFAVTCHRLDIIIFLITTYPHLFKKNIDQQDSRGSTALILAVYCGEEQTVNFLLQAGASPFIPNHNGFTPMQLSLHTRNQAVIDTLKKIYSNVKALPYDQFVKDCQFIQWIGHGLGVEANIKVKKDHNGVVKVSSIASPDGLNELDLLLFLLKEYIARMTDKNDSKKHFEKIFKSVQKTIDYSRFQNNVTAATLAEHYKQEMTIVPFSSTNHTMGLVLYKDWVILCNRGEYIRLLDAGMTIFKIRNKHNITSAYLSSLYSKINDEKTTFRLYEILFDKKDGLFYEEEDILIQFNNKQQKFPTCSFSNLKVTIQGMLYLLKHEYLTEITKAAILNKIADPNLIQKKISMDSQSYAKTTYKNFSCWYRNYLVDYFCHKAKLAHEPHQKSLGNQDPQPILKAVQSHPPVNQLYYDLGLAILTKHHGQERPDLKYDRKEKMEQELNRAKKICLTLYQINQESAKKLIPCLKQQNINSPPLFRILDPNLKI